jgi:hypothetical protein
MFSTNQRNVLNIFPSGDYRTVKKPGQRSSEVTIDRRWAVVRRSPKNSLCMLSTSRPFVGKSHPRGLISS